MGVSDLVEINGTRLFVDDRGPRDGQPLVYIHGGPGQSCWDFMAAVGDDLAARGLRVIGVDQRGVLRSDVLPDEPPLTVPVLIEDFEQLRESLGLRDWSLLGHSAGGGYALDYCHTRPGSVRAAIFDCPSWDADATDRYRLPIAATLLDAVGKHDAATTCREVERVPGRLSFSTKRLEAMQQLGSDYMRLFTHDDAGRAAYESLASAAPTDLDWSKGESHLPLVEDMYRDRVRTLVQLQCPSMLLHGESDLVTPPQVIDRYRSDVTAAHEVVTLERAGHFAWAEQPATYVDAVARFITATC